jgi:hypothetical protein
MYRIDSVISRKFITLKISLKVGEPSFRLEVQGLNKRYQVFKSV